MCGVQSIAHLGWRCLHIKPIQSLVLRLQASLCEHVQQREQAIDIAMGHAESKGKLLMPMALLGGVLARASHRLQAQ